MKSNLPLPDDQKVTPFSKEEIKALEAYFLNKVFFSEPPQAVRGYIDPDFGGFKYDYSQLVARTNPTLAELATNHRIGFVDTAVEKGRLVKILIEDLPPETPPEVVQAMLGLDEESYLLLYFDDLVAFVGKPEVADQVRGNGYLSVSSLKYTD